MESKQKEENLNIFVSIGFRNLNHNIFNFCKFIICIFLCDYSYQHPFEVGIIRQFTFSSSAQRMSVITRTMGEDHMDIHCKGAPEKVASLCRPESGK